jgi:hypothetical protein
MSSARMKMMLGVWAADAEFRVQSPESSGQK